LLRSFHARLLVIERRRYRSKRMHPTDLEFDRAHALMTVACVVLGVVFLGFAGLVTIIGQPFVDFVFSLFGG
jgi:hypothetical protein